MAELMMVWSDNEWQWALVLSRVEGEDETWFNVRLADDSLATIPRRLTVDG